MKINLLFDIYFWVSTSSYMILIYTLFLNRRRIKDYKLTFNLEVAIQFTLYIYSFINLFR